MQIVAKLTDLKIPSGGQNPPPPMITLEYQGGDPVTGLQKGVTYDVTFTPR
jgi:hypothetical protein